MPSSPSCSSNTSRMQFSFQQKRKLPPSVSSKPFKRLSAHRQQQSWEEEYFAGTEAIVGEERRWISDIEQTSLRFSTTLHFVGPLNQPPSETPAQVWLTQGHSKYAVKLFKPYTDEDAKSQLAHLPDPKPSLQKVKHDYSPFLQEMKAYERIRKFCPESQRHFFLTYHGTIDIPRSSGHHQGVVIDLLQLGIENRRLQSASVPEGFRPHLDSLRLALVDMDLSEVEERWYLSVLKSRLKMVTALHALGISHGDIKSDCFGLPVSLHDIALYDFSRSYTFTPERPCRLRLRPLKREVDVERRHVRETVLDLAKSARLLHHFATLLNTTAEKARDMLRIRVPRHLLPTELSVVRLSIILENSDPFFPSLSSILPFLEPTASGRPAEWTVTMVKHLDDFVCVSYSEMKDCAVPSKSFILASLVSSGGVIIEQLSLLCPHGSPPSKSAFALLPSTWLGTLDTRRLVWILLHSPSFCGTEKTVTVLDRQQLDTEMKEVH
ncbi:uncharacterized protein PV07_04729 [Cladophialophora immunda]|uniref:Protein kinase domain-containing protein n=1 Tax=Cladophialophora immunda TaxID=569365 RepID=A0A0D1ZLM7_9EURO|nr:uncharacterized protein PV07_04729 [Cladophialophora immunda]KIW28866.1 hypothetical protein PV07_04729 [Cladophialophora immunda]